MYQRYHIYIYIIYVYIYILHIYIWSCMYDGSNICSPSKKVLYHLPNASYMHRIAYLYADGLYHRMPSMTLQQGHQQEGKFVGMTPHHYWQLRKGSKMGAIHFVCKFWYNIIYIIYKLHPGKIQSQTRNKIQYVYIRLYRNACESRTRPTTTNQQKTTLQQHPKTRPVVRNRSLRCEAPGTGGCGRLRSSPLFWGGPKQRCWLPTSSTLNGGWVVYNRNKGKDLLIDPFWRRFHTCHLLLWAKLRLKFGIETWKHKQGHPLWLQMHQSQHLVWLKK